MTSMDGDGRDGSMVYESDHERVRQIHFQVYRLLFRII